MAKNMLYILRNGSYIHFMIKTCQLLDPIPPGKILCEEFMKPLGLSANQLARDIDVPPGRISEIVNGKRSITADTALRLGKYFGVSPEVWLNLQSDYDMRLAHRTIWPLIEPRVRVRDERCSFLSVIFCREVVSSPSL